MEHNMYTVVVSLNGKQQVYEHGNLETAMTRWDYTVKDAREAMKAMGKELATLFDAKVYITRLEEGKKKIIMAFDTEGRLEFV